MLINSKWINSLRNCDACSIFEWVSSDHRIVSPKIRVSLRVNKPKAASIPRYDWSTLLFNDDMRNRYTVSVRKLFDNYQQDTDHHTADSTYDNFVIAHSEAAVHCIQLKPKLKRRDPWETVAITEKREHLKVWLKSKALIQQNPMLQT